ncbi:MAG: hypothetical protein ABL995_09120 [Bryobacteraceae bacterium]
MFKAIRVKSRAEFDWLIDHLTTEVYRVRDNWEAWKTIDEAAKTHVRELTQTPGFWELTKQAHKDAVVLRLGRLYDPHPTATSLGNLLQTLRENMTRSGTSFPAAITNIRAADIDKDIAKVSNAEAAIEKLLALRNEYLAHRGTRHVTKGSYAALPTLNAKEISGLILKGIRLMSKYRECLGYRTVGWGHHERQEFRVLLKLLRTGLRSRR